MYQIQNNHIKNGDLHFFSKTQQLPLEFFSEQKCYASEIIKCSIVIALFRCSIMIGRAAGMACQPPAAVQSERME